MRTTDRLDLVIRYIDAHISQPMTAEGLASIAGYSIHHFAHSFRSHTGLPVASYIRRRRLALAERGLRAGMTSTEAAAKFGFETPSGFSKAFRKCYGMSPQQYKAAYSGPLKPQIEELPEFTAVVYRLAPPVGQFDILDSAAYWTGKEVSGTTPADYTRIAGSGAPEIGVWLPPDPVTGEFYYAFGPITEKTDFVPEDMSMIRIPAARYAVFDVPPSTFARDLNQNISCVWHSIFDRWFDESGCRFDEDKLAFERYHGTSTRIYIPITQE